MTIKISVPCIALAFLNLERLSILGVCNNCNGVPFPSVSPWPWDSPPTTHLGFCHIYPRSEIHTPHAEHFELYRFSSSLNHAASTFNLLKTMSYYVMYLSSFTILTLQICPWGLEAGFSLQRPTFSRHKLQWRSKEKTNVMSINYIERPKISHVSTE